MCNETGMCDTFKKQQAMTEEIGDLIETWIARGEPSTRINMMLLRASVEFAVGLGVPLHVIIEKTIETEDAIKEMVTS